VLATAAHKFSVFVHSVAPSSNCKCYWAGETQAALEVQNGELILAKQAINTQLTTTTDYTLHGLLMQHSSGAALIWHDDGS